MAVCSISDRMGVAEGFCKTSISSGPLAQAMRANVRSRSTSLPSLSRKKLKTFGDVHQQCGLASRSLSIGREDCGCGGTIQSVGKGAGTGAIRFDIERQDRLRSSVFSSRRLQAANLQVRARKTRASLSEAAIVIGSEVKREFVASLNTIVPARRVGVEDRQLGGLSYLRRSIISAAAAAGLSFALCSTAMAEPLIMPAPIQVPAAAVSENLRMFVESQLRRELQTEMKAQEEWLDAIGQPLNQWTIDDRVRKVLEGRARSQLDENGNVVSKLEILESEVVPMFKSPVIAENPKVASASNTNQEIAVEIVTPIQTRKSNFTLPSSPAPNQLTPPLDGAPETVAVPANLGSVVPVASRKLSSTASLAVNDAGRVPGMSLIARIMMHFGGGGIAGALGASLVYPLDTIKTRMQAQSSKPGDEGHFKNEWDCFIYIMTKEGVGSLYRGLGPQLLGIAPEKAMKLTVNEVLMEILESELPAVGPWILEIFAGGGGGFSQVVFTNPMEIVKVRLQTQSQDGKQKNMLEVIRDLGPKGLFDGVAITLARDVPSTALFFVVYTCIQNSYPDHNFWAGFVAAIPATVLVTPFDVAKTRLQMAKTGGEEYANGFDCLFAILRKEGMPALFKGSVARVLKTSPQFGITFMLYSTLLDFQARYL